MFKINKQNGNTCYGIVELVADTEEDIKTLSKEYEAGSTVFVIQSSNVYMLNTKKEWKKI